METIVNRGRLLPLRGLMVLAVVLVFTSTLVAAELSPEETLLRSNFRTATGTSHTFLRMTEKQPATFLFCGAGELKILSRGFLDSEASALRYSLSASIDGEDRPQELDYRATRIDSGGFDGRAAASGLRRANFHVGRGCHTLKVEVLHSTQAVVGVRVLFDEREPRRRAWRPTTVTGGHGTEVVVRESRTAYRRLPAGETLRFSVQGPTWVRLLAREVGGNDIARHALNIRAGGKILRSYALLSTPSHGARMDSDEETTIGRANEVVFQLPAGSHQLEAGATGPTQLLLRAQVADRQEIPEKKALRAPWNTRARVSSYYDSNILRYSDKFIRRFDEGKDAGRFRVESLDDIVHRADVSVVRRFSGLRGREGQFSLDLEHRAYQRNAIKDWSRVSVSWQQKLRRRKRVDFRLSLIPDFYVRHLRDSDLTGEASSADPFQAFEFRKTEGLLTFSQPMAASFRGRFHLGYASFDHSEAFREFDSNNLLAGVRIDQEVSRRVRLSYAVDLVTSRAQGYDQEGETRTTSDDTDPSYRQYSYQFSARFRSSGQRRQTLLLQAEWEQRDYTTDRGSRVAPLHAGREDDFLRLYGSWELAFSKRNSLTVFAQTRDRSSTAPVVLDIGVEKDYSQVEAGIRFTRRFRR